MNLGLIGSVAMLLLFPVACVFRSGTGRQSRLLAVTYFLYLAMGAANPILFSSMRTLILAMLLASTFIDVEIGARFMARATS